MEFLLFQYCIAYIVYVIVMTNFIAKFFFQSGVCSYQEIRDISTLVSSFGTYFLIRWKDIMYEKIKKFEKS